MRDLYVDPIFPGLYIYNLCAYTVIIIIIETKRADTVCIWRPICVYVLKSKISQKKKNISELKNGRTESNKSYNREITLCNVLFPISYYLNETHNF